MPKCSKKSDVFLNYDSNFHLSVITTCFYHRVYRITDKIKTMTEISIDIKTAESTFALKVSVVLAYAELEQPIFETLVVGPSLAHSLCWLCFACFAFRCAR